MSCNCYEICKIGFLNTGCIFEKHNRPRLESSQEICSIRSNCALIMPEKTIWFKLGSLLGLYSTRDKPVYLNTFINVTTRGESNVPILTTHLLGTVTQTHYTRYMHSCTHITHIFFFAGYHNRMT